MRLLENWTKPRDGELVSGFVVAQEGDHLLCVGEDGMALRLSPTAMARMSRPMRYVWVRLGESGWVVAAPPKKAAA